MGRDLQLHPQGAVEDGQQFLADEKTTQEAGFRWPVFITIAVFKTSVVVPDGVEAQGVQERLWDLLWMARQAISGAKSDGTIEFVFYVRNDSRAAKPLTVYMQAWPVDVERPSPAITIRTHEDLWQAGPREAIGGVAPACARRCRTPVHRIASPRRQ
ncbi:MAG: DUF6573 family protein [Armatimonadota bacterium]